MWCAVAVSNPHARSRRMRLRSILPISLRTWPAASPSSAGRTELAVMSVSASRKTGETAPPAPTGTHPRPRTDGDRILGSPAMRRAR